MMNYTQLFRLLIVIPPHLQFLLLLSRVTPQCQDVYTASTRDLTISNTNFQVSCQPGVDGKQWVTLLTHKTDILDFSQFTWNDFAYQGVGSFNGDFVQALDEMHLLTKSKQFELLVQLSKAGSSKWALYQKFSIGAENTQFALRVSEYDPSSTAVDALSQHNGMQWSSPDRDNDAMANWNCAQSLSTSFWFSSCYGTNPLGQYSATGDKAMVWETVQEKMIVDSITFKVRERLCETGTGLECHQCKTGYYLCTSDTGYTTCCTKPISTCEAANHSGKFDITSGIGTTTVMCDMQTDGGGWAQLLARRDGSVNDFYLYIFDKYASEGIGEAGKDNIVALDYWNLITATSPQQLLIEMTHQAQYFWVMYHTFSVGDKSESYRFSIADYDNHSTGGKSLDSSNGMKFSTLDVDNDLNQSQNCAIIFRRPFWNSKCGFVGPLSKYGSASPGQGVYWQGVTGCCSSLETIFFKSRTKRCAVHVDNHCSECEPGYSLETDAVSGRHTCTPVCNQEGCTQCHSINPRVCIGSCNPGYYYTEGTRSCHKCASHCATCSDYDVCESCSNNGVVYEGSCYSECPATFYPDESRNCMKCPQDNCSKCAASQCLHCTKPYFLFEKECTLTCPDGYYGDQKLNQCLPCADQCTTCTGPSSRDCQTCNTALNYEWKAPSSCVCPARHFPARDKMCTQCHSRCLICLGPSQVECLECLPDYWKKDEQCYRCQDTPGLVTESHGVCKQVCGDGVDLGVNQCEDGNTEDGDGCSAKCEIEPNYACRSQTPYGPFLCWETIPPIMSGASINHNYILTIQFSEPVLSMHILSEDDFVVETKGPRELPFSFTRLQPDSLELFQQISLKIIPQQDILPQDKFQISVKLFNFTKIRDINNNMLVASQILLSMPQYTYTKPQAQIITQTSSLADILYLCFSPEKRPGLLSNALLLFTLSGLGGGVMWDLVFHLQLINFLPLIGVPLPADILKVYTVFSGTNLDFQAIEGPLSTSTIEANYIQVSSLNKRYGAYRFQNSNFLINCCFILLLLNFQILLLPLLYLFRKIFRCFTCRNFLRKVIKYYWFNLMLRMVLLCFVQVFFSAVLNLIKISFRTATQSFSSILSILFIIPLLLLPMLVISIMRRPASRILSVKFKGKLGVLSEGLEINKQSWAAKHFFSWFIIRRLLFVLFLILLRFSTRLQILLIMLLSLLTLTYVIRVKPFLENSTNTLLVLNQIVIIAILVLFMGFSMLDSSHLSFYQLASWFSIFLPLFSIIAHSIVSIRLNFKKCRQTHKVSPVVLPDMPCKTKTDLLDDQTPRIPSYDKRGSANWEIMVNSTPTSSKRHVRSFSKFENEEFKLDSDLDPSSDRNFFTRQETIRSHASTSAIHYKGAHGRKFSSTDIHSKFRKISINDLNYASEEVRSPSNLSERDDVSRLSSRNLHPDFKESNVSLSVPSFYPSPKQSTSFVVQNKRKMFVQSRSFNKSMDQDKDLRQNLKPKLSQRDMEDKKYAIKVHSFWENAKREKKISSFKKRKQAFE